VIGSLQAVTRVVRDIKIVSQQSSQCIERIQALEFSRNTRLTSITRRRGRTGERLMPSNSSPHELKFLQSLSDTMLRKSFMPAFYRASYRRFARPTRTCRASYMLCRLILALILSSRSTFFFATTIEYPVERGNSEAGRATPLSATNRPSSLTKRVRARVFGSPFGVRFTSEFTIFGVNGNSSRFEGHRTRWNVVCYGDSDLSYDLWLYHI